MAEEPRYWFPAKRFGWGWGAPATWQGWAVLGIWLLGLTVGLIAIGLQRSPLAHVLFVVAMSALLILICYWKGAPPRWRWGED